MTLNSKPGAGEVGNYQVPVRDCFYRPHTVGQRKDNPKNFVDQAVKAKEWVPGAKY